MDSEEGLLEKISASSTPKSSSSLPQIKYFRSQIEDIVKASKMHSDKQNKIRAYLDTIDEQIKEIENYQSVEIYPSLRENAELFYEAISSCLLLVNNISEEIKEITHNYNAVLSVAAPTETGPLI